MSVKEVQAYSLSDKDLRQLLGDDIKIIIYPELANYKNINQCFDSRGRCIILYLTEDEHTGHWCCMIKRHSNIEFFDPYGDAPEEQKGYIPRDNLIALQEDRPLLYNLMKASNIPITYNSHKFQREGGGIATCGKHCVSRLAFAPFSLDKYNAVIEKSGLSPDKFVCGLVYDKIKK